jgi:hypothetical protein
MLSTMQGKKKREIGGEIKSAGNEEINGLGMVEAVLQPCRPQ